MQLEFPHPRTAARRPRDHAASAQAIIGERALARAVACGVGATAFAVYLLTLAPTVMWYDMGEFATVSATLGIAHNTGYPLLILMGKVFTLLPLGGDAAYRVNVMSAVFTALAVMLVFGIVHDLTRDLVASAAAALTLAFAGTVWANATWATSYGLNLFFTALVLRLIFAWHRERSPRALIGAALAFGLGMANHRLIVLVAPPSLLLIALGWRDLRPRVIGIACLALFAGLSVYLYLPVRGEQEPAISWARPAEWRTYWAMFLNGQTPSSYWTFDIADRIDVLWSYPSYDLTWGGLALAGAGAVIALRRWPALAGALLMLAAADAAVVEAYSIHNIYNYLTPGYLALAVLAGVAVAAAGDWLRSTSARRAVEMRPWALTACVAGVAALLPAALIAQHGSRVDRSGDYSARDFAQTTLDRLAPGSVILTDSWAASPFWYLQFAEGGRQDVMVSPIFSVPGEDIRSFAEGYLDQGRGVYVVDGLRTPHDVFGDGYALQPIVVDSVEEMLINTLPKPKYRDDLVMTGSLYKLVRSDDAAALARLRCDGGCAPSRPIDLAAGDGVTLAGLDVDAPLVRRGDVAQLTFYWRTDAARQADLSAVTLFFDEEGRAQERHGFPLWSQTRKLGSGLLPTSTWQPGETVRESYFTLVPRDLSPGRYTVRVAVFDAADAADTAAAQSHLVDAGTVVVR